MTADKIERTVYEIDQALVRRSDGSTGRAIIVERD